MKKQIIVQPNFGGEERSIRLRIKKIQNVGQILIYLVDDKLYAFTFYFILIKEFPRTFHFWTRLTIWKIAQEENVIFLKELYIYKQNLLFSFSHGVGDKFLHILIGKCCFICQKRVSVELNFELLKKIKVIDKEKTKWTGNSFSRTPHCRHRITQVIMSVVVNVIKFNFACWKGCVCVGAHVAHCNTSFWSNLFI